MQQRTPVTAPVILQPEVPYPNQTATVDVSSLERADRATSSTLAIATGENLTGPADACATPGATARTQDSWYEEENHVTATSQPTGNGLAMTLTDLKTVTFDLRRAQVRTTSPVTLKTTGDGQSTLALQGPSNGPVTVTRDGVADGMLHPAEDRVVHAADLRGTHTFVLSPTIDSGVSPIAGGDGKAIATGTGSGSQTNDTSLAATGVSPGVVKLALTLLGLSYLAAAAGRRCQNR